jgi:hypothetical protein
VIDVVVPALEERRKKLDQPLFPFLTAGVPLIPFKMTFPEIWDACEEGASQDLLATRAIAQSLMGD